VAKNAATNERYSRFSCHGLVCVLESQQIGNQGAQCWVVLASRLVGRLERLYLLPFAVTALNATIMLLEEQLKSRGAEERRSERSEKVAVEIISNLLSQLCCSQCLCNIRRRVQGC
jgi:hypothetical protein